MTIIDEPEVETEHKNKHKTEHKNKHKTEHKTLDNLLLNQIIKEYKPKLIEELKPKSAIAKVTIEEAVQILVEQALQYACLISTEAIESIEFMIADIDKKLNDQINMIIHNEEFQELESAWRGLYYLINNTETEDKKLEIKVLNVSKKDLHEVSKKYDGNKWDQSPLFKAIYEKEYDQLGGSPYGCLVGDYYFDQDSPDVELLRNIAQVAAAAHAPFIAAAAPALMQLDSWQELNNKNNLTDIFNAEDYIDWRSLRKSDDAAYIGLTMPRFLARLPYGAKTNPVEAFNFEEDTGAADSRKYIWANSAYAMATNINQSFKEYGWCTRIRGLESGGLVEGLPMHTFKTDDGGIDMKCPTEVMISGQREAELAKNGFMPLIYSKNSNYAAFIGAESLKKPAIYTDSDDATDNARLSARLPYIFAASRFAHYLKCIVYQKIGSFKGREDMQRWLQNWIMKYVDGDPLNSNDNVKARKPLSAAEVVVEEIEGNPGYYAAKFLLQPHYQLEGLTVSLSLVSKLPSNT